MNTIVLYEDSVVIPDGISDLEAFRRWAHSEDFPDAGRICFLHGELWVDMSKEQVFTHNQLKQEFNLVLGGLVKVQRLGRFFPDGLLVTNDRGTARLPARRHFRESPDNEIETRSARGRRKRWLPGTRRHPRYGS